METMGKMMGSAIQPLEDSTSIADTSADAVGADIVQLPFTEARAQIARTESNCETLRQGIGTMQQGLKVLAGIVGGINDCETREKLQHQLHSMNELLLLRLDQLSSIDHLLQVALDRTRRPR
jgi:hypothetical protein